MKKTAFNKVASALLTVALAASPFNVAIAEESVEQPEETTSSPIVGSLTFVANYDTTKDFTDGHSFLMFTSYTDGLELNFTDLYGYYVPTEEFVAAEKADHSVASYVSNFKRVMSLNADLAAKYSNLTEEVWNGLTDEERSASYSDVVTAIQNYKDTQFVFTEGETQSDSRFKKTSATYTLDKGEYLTMGDYSMQDDLQQMALDALQYSTLKSSLLDALKDNMMDGHQPEEALNLLGEFLQDYIDGKISDDQAESKVYDYLSTVVTRTVVQNIIMPYLMEINLLDGDTTGGLFVNRELWRQIQWQSFDPCHVYSVDITQQQLDDLMAYMNSGDANHYSLAAHNCTTMATDGWNAAVGYVRDASGKNTDEQSALYMDEKDTTYDFLKGMISTPKRAYEVMGTWATQDLGGTAGSWTIVRGVEVYAASISTSAKNPVKGDIITVPITLKGVDVACAQGTLIYDDEALTLLGITAAEGVLAGTDFSFQVKDNMFSFYQNETDLTSGAVVATATFECKELSDNASIQLASVIGSMPVSTAEITFAIDPDTVEIPVIATDITLGDVNNNGKINIVDAQVAYDLASGVYGTYADGWSQALPESWNKASVFFAADVNKDNAVDAADAQAIQYYVHHGAFGAAE